MVIGYLDPYGLSLKEVGTLVPKDAKVRNVDLSVGLGFRV